MQEVCDSPRTPAASMLPGGKHAEEREVVAVAHNLPQEISHKAQDIRHKAYGIRHEDVEGREVVAVVHNLPQEIRHKTQGIRHKT